MRAREPRPYLDKNKQVPNSPEWRVGTNCQGRGGVPPPVTIFSLKTTNFAFSDRLLVSCFMNLSPVTLKYQGEITNFDLKRKKF
jgi:hypothetical protein